MPTAFEWAVTIFLPLVVTFRLYYTSGGSSDAMAPSSSYMRLFLEYLFLDATYGQLFHMILLVPARWIASRLPGSVAPLTDETKLSEQEEQTNDPTVIWPSPKVIEKLPKDWTLQEEMREKDVVTAKVVGIANHSTNKKRRSNKYKTSRVDSTNHNENKTTNENDATVTAKQPYYLNHVRGSIRIRQASQRIGAAMGTLFSSYLLCQHFFSPLSYDDIGIGKSSWSRIPFDITCGIAIGSSIVLVIFLIELQMGWIKVVGVFETVVPEERFGINFTWDVLFHVGVSINEEVMLRGWMFILGCHGMLPTTLDWFDHTSHAATFAIALSVVLQSTLFALLHFYSPGSTLVSLLNLFFGGVAAACNVMVTGGTMWLGIGWHFGWNITMGHILGRSTSGIPMSCAVFDVIPRPKSSYEKYHGGTFGPEQGVLAPLAYTMGMIMVIWLYGLDGLESWKESLVNELEKSQIKLQ